MGSKSRDDDSKPVVKMTATNRSGGRAETTVDGSGKVTQTSSGDTTGIHQSIGDQVIHETD